MDTLSLITLFTEDTLLQSLYFGCNTVLWVSLVHSICTVEARRVKILHRRLILKDELLLC